MVLPSISLFLAFLTRERGHSFESGVLPEIYYGGVSLSPRDSGPVADTKRRIGILFLKPAQGQIEEWGVPMLD